jgi:TusA-related sulfurtransferase
MPEPITVDLQGVPMPDHMQRAVNAVDQAAGGQVIVLLTDQEVVIKHVPSAAARVGVRIKMGMAGENIWKITMTPRIAE